MARVPALSVYCAMQGYWTLPGDTGGDTLPGETKAGRELGNALLGVSLTKPGVLLGTREGEELK